MLNNVFQTIFWRIFTDIKDDREKNDRLYKKRETTSFGIDHSYIKICFVSFKLYYSDVAGDRTST